MLWGSIGSFWCVTRFGKVLGRTILKTLATCQSDLMAWICSVQVPLCRRRPPRWRCFHAVHNGRYRRCNSDQRIATTIRNKTAKKTVDSSVPLSDSGNTSHDFVHPQPTYSLSSTPTAPAPAPFRRPDDLCVGSAAKRTETWKFRSHRSALRRPETSRVLATAPAVHSHTPPAVACAASAYISK